MQSGLVEVTGNKSPMSGNYSWGKNFLFGPLLNHCYSTDFLLTDQFTGYDSGLYTGNLNLSTSLKSGYSTIFISGGKTISLDIFFAESFEPYPTGGISGYVLISGDYSFDSGTILNLGVFKSGYNQITGKILGYSIWSGYL
jgi:hypothetical protein